MEGDSEFQSKFVEGTNMNIVSDGSDDQGVVELPQALKMTR